MDLIVALAPVALSGGLMAALAARKGYSPVIWFLTFSLLIPALIVLAFLPHTTKSDLTLDEAARKTKRGNVIGGVVAVLGFVGMLLITVLVWYTLPSLA